MTRDLRLVSFSLFCWGIGEGVFIYLQPLYLQQLGANPVQIGGIFGLAAATMTITHIPAGALADIFGRKRVMTAAWFCGLIAAIVMYLANTLPVFVGGMMLYYFTAFVVAPLNSYLTSARGEWSVARALTTTSALYSIGAIIGSLLGGTIGEVVGLRQGYGLSAAAFLISTSIIQFARKQPVEHEAGRRRYRALFSNRPLARFLGIALFALFAMYLSWPLTPNYLQNVRGVSIQQIGALGSINALGMVVLNLSLGRLLPRRGFLISHFTVWFSAALLWLGTSMPWLVAGYLFAAGYRTARALAAAQAEGLVRSSEMGLVFGLAETVAGLAMIIAPPIAGLLYRSSPALPFPISLGIIGLSLIITARFTPVLSRPSTSSDRTKEFVPKSEEAST